LAVPGGFPVHSPAREVSHELFEGLLTRALEFDLASISVSDRKVAERPQLVPTAGHHPHDPTPVHGGYP